MKLALPSFEKKVEADDDNDDEKGEHFLGVNLVESTGKINH